MIASQAEWRLTLLQGTGRRVLADLLDICHFGCMLNFENPAMIAEYNVGVAVLARLGIFGAKTRDEVINALCTVVPEKEEKDEKIAGSRVLTAGIDGFSGE